MDSSQQKLVENRLKQLLPSDDNLSNYIQYFNHTTPIILSEKASSSQSIELLTEAIVLRSGRPGLLIRNDDFTPIEPWSDLSAHTAVLRGCIPSVGRIDIRAGDRSRTIGTGWVFNNHIVTSRHVLTEFYALLSSNPPKYLRLEGNNGRIITKGVQDQQRYRAFINFRVEAGARISSEYSFELNEPVYFPPTLEPDVAVLSVNSSSLTGNPLPPSLRLATESCVVGQTVAVVGHPANDSKRNPDGALLQAFFQGHFNVKRLQPGLITGVDSTIFRHDCTTMGGSSGSPLLNVETGEVLGIHSRGEFMLHNSAVSATVLADWYAQ